MGVRPVPIPLAAVSVNATNCVGSVEKPAQGTRGIAQNVASPSAGAVAKKTPTQNPSASFATPTKAAAVVEKEAERNHQKRAQAGG